MTDEARRTRTATRQRGRANTLNALLLGVLSIFEVTFDILSLVAAILGGVAREGGSTSSTGSAGNAGGTRGARTAPEITSVASPQLAVQNVPQVTPVHRPTGVTVIAVLLCMLGVFELGFGVLALMTSLLGRFVVPLSSPAAGAALGAYYALKGLVILFFVWGLWRLQRWAFWATVFIAVVSLLSSALALTEPAASDWAFLPDFLIPVAVLVYFVVDPNVRTAFRTGQR